MNLRAQAFLLASLACACVHAPDNNARTSQTTTTGGGFVLPGSTGTGERSGGDPLSASSLELAQPEHPANRLGNAACERKLECDDIGASKQYTNGRACLTATRRRAHEALDGLSCANGLDAKALDACVKAVRIAECSEVDDVTKLEPCSYARLCVR